MNNSPCIGIFDFSVMILSVFQYAYDIKVWLEGRGEDERLIIKNPFSYNPILQTILSLSYIGHRI